MITVKSYQDGACSTRDLSDFLDSPPNAIPIETVVWIDMPEPTATEETEVLEKWLKVHELVLGDMHRAKQFDGNIDPHHPAVEEYENLLFVMVHAVVLPHLDTSASSGEFLRQVKVGQLNVILTENVIVTHHPVRIEVIESIKRFIQTNPQLMKRGPDFILAMVLDALVRNVGIVLDHIDTRMEELEDRMFQQENLMIPTRLLNLRRLITAARRSLVHQAEIVYQLGRGDYDLVNESEAIYYREVHDHYLMAIDHVDSLRDSVTGLTEVYFSLISSRLNQVMRVLTVISTIFLPITFITSLYGMNFKYMPELSSPYGYPLVIVAILTVSITMLLFFRRRGWLG